jgi:hypothetical protein
MLFAEEIDQHKIKNYRNDNGCNDCEICKALVPVDQQPVNYVPDY